MRDYGTSQYGHIAAPHFQGRTTVRAFLEFLKSVLVGESTLGADADKDPEGLAPRSCKSSLPVFGLRSRRRFFVRTINETNAESLTASPFVNVLVISLRTNSTKSADSETVTTPVSGRRLREDRRA